MPIERTKNFTWSRRAKASTCAKGSIRTKKGPNGLALRFCCPKGKLNWNGYECRVGMKLIALGRPRRRSLGDATIPVPRSHLREDVREARKMIKELQSGVRRDLKALKHRSR